MEKQPTKSEILAQIKKMQDDSASDKIELAKIEAERKALEKGPILEKNEEEKGKIEIEESPKESLTKKEKFITFVNTKEEPTEAINNTGEEKVENETPEDIKKELEAEFAISASRKEYFDLKNDKTKGLASSLSEEEYEKKLNEAEENYRKTRNEIMKTISETKGQDATNDFFLSEITLKRENDVKNGPLSARMKSGISKGIEKWDNLGNEGGVKGFTKRFAKTAISLSLLGICSVGSVQGLANLGIGSATALSSGATSYLGQRLAGGLLLGGVIMESVPDKYKKLVSGALMAVSGGLAIAGGGYVVAAAMGVGYGLSRLTRRYDKKIKNRIEFIKNNINIDTLDADSKNLEEEMEKALKKAETTRIFGKIIEGTVALTASVGVIEASGYVQDNNQVQNDSKEEENEKQEQTKENNPPTNTEKTESNTNTDNTPTPNTQNIPETKIEQSPSPDAVVHKGEGIEHSFIRQIENNHVLAKELGFTGNMDDAKALHEFAGKEAHIIAIEQGYVDSDTGHEIRIAKADEVAYEIRLDKEHNIFVDEKNIDGKILDTHQTGDKFEENIEKHEYSDGKDHRLDNNTEPMGGEREQELSEYEESFETPSMSEDGQNANSFHQGGESESEYVEIPIDQTVEDTAETSGDHKINEANIL